MAGTNEVQQEYFKHFSDVGKISLNDMYAKAAHVYDDSHASMGYPDPQICFDTCTSHGIPQDALIVDVGCGTGLSTKYFHANGFTNITGLDPSDAMRKVAADSGRYSDLDEFYLESEGVPDKYHGKFDLSIAVGVFVKHHVTPEGFHDMLNFTKKGGLIYFNTRSDQDELLKYAEKVDELIQGGQWELVEKRIYDKFKNCEPSDVNEWYNVNVKGIGRLLRKTAE